MCGAARRALLSATRSPPRVSERAARLAAVKQSLSISEARRIALAAQGFAQRRPEAAGTRQLNTAMARMATLQIDSVNVFARSHYMPLFSRVGAYDTAALDRLLFARRAPYVEFWAHMASFIPADDWGLFRFRMDEMRAKYGAPGGWYRDASRDRRLGEVGAGRPGTAPAGADRA